MRSAKVMLLGDMGVGKTSILYRLVHDRFDGQYKTTLGVEILSYDVPPSPATGDEPVRLLLWDTDGDFGTKIFDTVYVMGASAAIIVADITRPQTIEKMVTLAREFENRFPGRPYRALIDKIDLAASPETLVSPDQLPAQAVQFVSAKTSTGVTDSFAALAQTIYRRQS